MGLHVAHGVAIHGIALNVEPDLSHFELIVPCGLAGRAVSSVRGELGAAGPDLERVKGVFVETFADAVSAQSAGAVSL